MTNEVAIKAIQDFIGWFKEDSLIRKALDMAIKALSQEPCDDAISREHLLSEIGELKQSPWFNRGKDFDMDNPDFQHAMYLERKEAVEMIEDICIKKEPSVTQKSGKWIERQNIERSDLETAVNLRWRYECSECGYEVRSKYHYCPNCGARMESEEV